MHPKKKKYKKNWNRDNEENMNKNNQYEDYYGFENKEKTDNYYTTEEAKLQESQDNISIELSLNEDEGVILEKDDKDYTMTIEEAEKIERELEIKTRGRKIIFKDQNIRELIEKKK